LMRFIKKSTNFYQLAQKKYIDQKRRRHLNIENIAIKK